MHVCASPACSSLADLPNTTTMLALLSEEIVWHLHSILWQQIKKVSVSPSCQVSCAQLTGPVRRTLLCQGIRRRQQRAAASTPRCQLDSHRHRAPTGRTPSPYCRRCRPWWRGGAVSWGSYSLTTTLPAPLTWCRAVIPSAFEQLIISSTSSSVGLVDSLASFSITWASSVSPLAQAARNSAARSNLTRLLHVEMTPRVSRHTPWTSCESELIDTHS